MNYGPRGASPRKKDLIVIAFDHRNHGSRLVNIMRNAQWSKDPMMNNDQHAVDLYAIQTGSAQDVSFLIDHLPSVLYPSNERTIVEWGMGGISVGGHSTWIALSREPRLKIGIPIIGCPDYTKMMSQRAAFAGVPFEPPYFPDSLKTYVDANDPANLPYRAKDRSNPYLGRKILVLAGEMDPLVPWETVSEFAENLEVGEEGMKRIVVEDGAGHEPTPKMQQEAGMFVKKWLNDWNNAKL
ncbi:Alpha/Beta hydrolase protein [Suillus ampliporus]|nr:Alpha/Beta hydrolase protein [Suillus ampliporus]